MEEHVYLFLYNPCIWESSFATISIHRTKKGAYQAMRKHKLKCYEEYRKREIYFKRDRFFTDKFGADESWIIEKQKIEE